MQCIRQSSRLIALTNKFPTLAIHTTPRFTGVRTMKTLGLIGGMTYHATLIYYKNINDHVQRTLGNGHSASLILRSFDFADIMSYFHASNHREVLHQLTEAGNNLKLGGAKAFALCVNTCHMYADELEASVGVPLLHIMDFTGQAIRKAGLTKVALLGTKPVMEGDFMIGRLRDKYGIEVLIPEKEEERKAMHDLIFGPLADGIVDDNTRRLYQGAVEELVRQGAQGIILGCTELQFVIKSSDVDVPLFETVNLHSRGLAEWMLKD